VRMTNDKERVAHVNRLRPPLRSCVEEQCSNDVGEWSPPLFQYHCEDKPAPAPPDEPPTPPQSEQTVTTRSGRIVRPVMFRAPPKKPPSKTILETSFATKITLTQ